MIRKLELETVANPAPKLQWEATSNGMALFNGGDVIFCDKECGDSDEISVVQSKFS